MEDTINVHDEFYIVAASSRPDDRTQVLKRGETFAVLDRYGNLTPLGLGEQGIYHQGTRHLSRLDLRLGKTRLLLLGSSTKDDNQVLTVDLANADIALDGSVVLPRGTLHVLRSKLLWAGACYERLRVSNHGLVPVELELRFLFDADFADIFEVRGMKRERRGRRLPDEVGKSSVVLSYEGLDGVVRRSRLEWSPAPDKITSSSATLLVRLEPKESTSYLFTLTCEAADSPSEAVDYQEALQSCAASLHRSKAQLVRVTTSSDDLNGWLTRSVADVHMMVAETPSGPYPHAGVPWFSSPFGRDGIITALELLWLDPSLARGVLSFLAATQAREEAVEQDAEPGKVLHESRKGEMAALGEIPFGRYYGSIDSTPLFVILSGAYYERTGDRAFIESIWPNVEAALSWIDGYGDLDGDGFVEYRRKSPHGLLHQGWKDSHDSIFHADGRLAEGPIALCEVQAYVYAAWSRAAKLAFALGKIERASALQRRALELRDHFEEAFWSDELSTYALALDGQKSPCLVRTSNAGHCLFAGISTPERAGRVAETLFSPASFSGWGIRTVARGELRYNPMSYHNGSVWPHDNALIAMGLARYGRTDLVEPIFTGLFEAAKSFDLQRLPELFCGFPRRRGQGPTSYPVACSPQAWAAGSIFLLLQASLGLTVNALQRKIDFSRPRLPAWLRRVWIRDLRVGEAGVDILLYRHRDQVAINVLRADGPIEVRVLK